MTYLRRRWLALLLSSPSLALLAYASSAHAADLSAQAKAMADASASDAVNIRGEVYSKAPPVTAVLERDKYGSDVVHAFGPIIAANKNPDAVLNSAILIAQMGTLSTDGQLEAMLQHPDPSVRYWAAKGLQGIMGDLHKLPGALADAIKALKAADLAEKSEIVKAAMDHALTAAGVTPPTSAPSSE